MIDNSFIQISDFELRSSDEEELAEPSASIATSSPEPSAPSAAFLDAPPSAFVDTDDVVLEGGASDDMRDIGNKPFSTPDSH